MDLKPITELPISVTVEAREAARDLVRSANLMSRWGKDHWSTFAYLETRCVDYRGVPNREHMRCDTDLHPHYANSANSFSKTKYPTRLRGGELLHDHDDWSCLDDAEEAGLIIGVGTGLHPVYRMTELGQKIAQQLRAHKAAGGNFADFQPVL